MAITYAVYTTALDSKNRWVCSSCVQLRVSGHASFLSLVGVEAACNRSIVRIITIYG
jgi:hypothetical protein